ncbi:MAG: hypothetical protein JSS14_29125 [Proteobacteria bacterium]|nr:hypothetical protein [Pseudomonadota bacterium]
MTKEQEGPINGSSGQMMEGLIAEATQTLADITLKAQHVTSITDELLDAQKQTATGLAEMHLRSTQIATIAGEALAAKAQISDYQTVIATKSDHIEQAQIHADKVRGDLDRQLTAAKQQATDAEAFKARAQSASDSASEILLATKAARTTAEAESKAVEDLAAEAKEATDSLKDLAAKAQTVDERLANYEEQLKNLRAQSEAQLAVIIGLLPGATSAGLASAFDERRKSFLKPSGRWQWMFVGSLVVLIFLALTGLWNVYAAGTPLSYDELFRLWLARLPIAAALIWLALHASREAALAKRLEEDYGYKAAIAASFQGFHKQMSDLTERATPETPLAKLCADTLTTIGSPPGRIYDKHNLTSTPTAEAAQVVKELVQPIVVSKATPTPAA